MNQIVSRQVFDDGGYQLRKTDDKIILDVWKNGKCFSIIKTDLEFLTWKLKKHCKELCNEIDDYLVRK